METQHAKTYMICSKNSYKTEVYRINTYIMKKKSQVNTLIIYIDGPGKE